LGERARHTGLTTKNIKRVKKGGFLIVPQKNQRGTIILGGGWKKGRVQG
jgi:hypothetical protein